MKKILLILLLSSSLSSFTKTNISVEKPQIELSIEKPTTIEQAYFPGVHYSHKACCLQDILINGWWYHARWTKYTDSFGNYYWSFVWVLN